MGPASAYQSVLKSIDDMVDKLLNSDPKMFSFSKLSDGIIDIRDFQTTGVVAFANGLPFTKVPVGSVQMPGRTVQIRSDYL